MAIGINDLDDDDLMLETSQETQTYETPIQTQESPISDDFLSDYLKSKGIDDISKIKFEDDNGNIEEKDWNTLTK